MLFRSSGVDNESVSVFINDIKDHIEKLKVSLPEDIEEYTTQNEENKEVDLSGKEVTPILNIALSTYYKGTGLEEVLKKLEEYLDNANENESDITNI